MDYNQPRIQWHYRDSLGAVQIATGILSKDCGDRLQVEIVRDGVSTGEMVTILKTHAIADQSVLGDARGLKDRFKFGTPSDSQMARINQYLPNGAEPMRSDQLVTVPFVAADNLINRSYDAWDAGSLAMMAKLMPGLPALLDHDWGDTSKEWGRIYSSELIKSNSAPDEAIDRAGNKEVNKSIVAKNGFIQVVFEVFAPIDSPVVRALRRGHSGSISTGGFRFTDYMCPTCNTSFNDENCSHVIPDPWYAVPGRHEAIAPYAIRTGMFDLGEASIVAIPNLPNAGVI